MADKPYRELAIRADSPSRLLTVEQLVDLRLATSTLTAEQCHKLLGELDDQQVKNAVFDRALCFPFDPWTRNIRMCYAKQVQADNKVVRSFDNTTAHVEKLFATWRDTDVLRDGDSESFEAHVKSYLAPSIDNIGVYATYSDYIVTKINGLTALLKIGQILVGLPILTSTQGKMLFLYDPLSRAVGNIISSTNTDAIRREVLSAATEAEFNELAKRANTIGVFPGLAKALRPGAIITPYSVPHGEQLNKNHIKRASDEQHTPVTKKSKTAHLGRGHSYPQDGLTPGSSRASSQQPRGVTEGWTTESSVPQNPFSGPASARPITPPFAKSAHSTPTSATDAKHQHPEQEQAQGSVKDLDESSEVQGVTNEATEHHAGSQNGHQAATDEQAQNEQAVAQFDFPAGSGVQQCPDITSAEGDVAQQPDHKESGANVEQLKPGAYDELLQNIEAAMFYGDINETPDSQLARAPAVVSLVEGTCGTILQQLNQVAAECQTSGRRDLFLGSLNDTVFALLWVIESCALDVAGTPLTGEVSRTVSRRTLIGALWGAVRLADRPEQKDLLEVTDSTTSETFAEKLERIVRRMDETGVAGFKDMPFIVQNMRAAEPAVDPSLS
ncbi:hypothetical protein diail_4259 [Diaporthe ilicicola]|nr:hypothetical protein diail_4259 [Diaporthe ilicicola]